jgi:hypothetical protein
MPALGASSQFTAVAVFLCKTVGVVLRWFESITRHGKKRPLTRRNAGQGPLLRGLSAPRLVKPGARRPGRVARGCDQRGCHCLMGKARAAQRWNLGSVRNPCGYLRPSVIPGPVFGVAAEAVAGPEPAVWPRRAQWPGDWPTRAPLWGVPGELPRRRSGRMSGASAHRGSGGRFGCRWRSVRGR